MTILAALPLLSAASLAADSETQLIGQIRTLTQQFDRIASRDPASPANLGQAREQYGNYLRDGAASGSDSQALRVHAEIFVLSGGDSSILQPYEAGLKPGSQEKKLFDGIIAYASGNASEAETALLSLDATSFDPIRGGHLALAQALLASRADPQRAFAYFDTARLLLPGTLVEEAALRQIVVLAAKTSNRERFSSAAISYLSRFHRSAYVAGFEAQLAYHIARFPGSGGLLILQELLNAHPKGWGRCLACFLVRVAEQAISLGKADLASAAALAGMALVSGDTAEKQQLLLYYGAALIVTDEFPRGLDALHSVNQANLDQKDKELLHASLALAAKLRVTPVLLDSAKLDALASDTPKHNRAFLAGDREHEARAALANADALLRQAK